MVVVEYFAGEQKDEVQENCDFAEEMLNI